jgi:hypothetical protein
MPLQNEILRIANYRGLNVRASKFIIPDGAAQRLVNFVFDEEGVLTVIGGHQRWNSTSLGTGKIQGGTRFYRVGASPELIIAHNGNLYKGDDSTKTFSLIKSGLNATNLVEMVPFRNLLFIVNGSDRPLKWNGSQVTLMGLDPPATAPTVTDSGAGNLNGTYSWKVTFVSPTHESNGSPASSTLTVTNRQVTLSNIPTSTDPQVTKRRIYRTLAGGTIYKFVGEINDNTTTTFVDNVPDVSLGPDIPVDKDPPPNGAILEVFKNRVWMAGVSGFPQRLFFSEYFEPEAWPPTYFVDLPLAQGDKITGLKVLGDVLVVYGKNQPLIILGETPFDFVVRRTFANVGAESQRAIVKVENTHVFLSRFGIYGFDGAIARLLSDDIAPIIRKIPPDKMTNAAAVYYDKKKQIRFAVYHEDMRDTATETHNNSELIYDLRTSSWSQSTKKIQHYIPLDGPGDPGSILTTSPTDGLVYEEDKGLTFDGNGFSAFWTSKAFGPRSIDLPKQWRYYLGWLNQGDGQAIIELLLDEGVSTVPISFDLTTMALSTYGNATYGSSTYSPPSALIRLEKSLPRDAVSRIIEISMEIKVPSTAINGPIKIIANELIYRAIPNFRFVGGN